MSTPHIPGRVDRAIPIQRYPRPLSKRLFYALIRAGWLVVLLVLATLVLTGCDDTKAEEATAASLRDALAQAQRDRPDLWTPERSARADAAAGMVARGVQP